MADEDLRSLERRWRTTMAWTDWVAWARVLRRSGDDVPWRFYRAVERATRLSSRILALSRREIMVSDEMRISNLASGRLDAAANEGARVVGFLERRNAVPFVLSGAPKAVSVILNLWATRRARGHVKRTRNLEVPQDSRPQPTHLLLLRDSLGGRLACGLPSDGNVRLFTGIRDRATCERCLAATSQVRRVCNECDQDVLGDGSCGCTPEMIEEANHG